MTTGREETTVDCASQAAEVRACAGRTLAAAGAVVEWHKEWVPRSHGEAPRRRRRGGVLRPVGKGAGYVAKTVWNRTTNNFPFGDMAARGILEPATGRYMLDFGSFAQLYDGHDVFGGRSGRPLRTLSRFSAPGGDHDVLWVLRVLLGTAEASAEGEDVLHGSICPKFGVLIDLASASKATPGGLRPPRVDRFEQLQALPGAVWLDGEHVRRVRFADINSQRLTLELWRVGVATDQLDWSRLPAFKSPAEAARYAGQSEPWHDKLRSRIGH